MLVAVLYYDKHYLLEQDTHLQKCNIIANISVGLDVNILHCVEWLGLTDPLVLPCVLNVTPYLKSAIVFMTRGGGGGHSGTGGGRTFVTYFAEEGVFF